MPGISGPIVDIVKKFDHAVTSWSLAHTHRAYVCEIDRTARYLGRQIRHARSRRSISSSIR